MVEEEEKDPFGVLEKECDISCSQEHTLAHSYFARQHHFPPPSPDVVVGITNCSAPKTPQNDDGGVSTTPQPEEYKTPPEVAATTSTSSVATAMSSGGEHSLKLGFSEERASVSRKREREEEEDISPAAKKLKGFDDLGFPESGREVGEGGTVVLGSDDDNEFEEGRENGGNTEVMNDIDDDGDGDGDGEKETRTTPTATTTSTANIRNEILELRAEMSNNGKLNLNLNLEANANSKDEMNLMKFLTEALRKISEFNQEDKDDKPYDIFETAKLRGLTFPRSRWYDRE